MKIKHIFNPKSLEGQKWKMSQPYLNNFQISVSIGMILGDANVSKHGKFAYLKFEQSKLQYLFIHNLWSIFKQYTFMNHIGVRFNKSTTEIKSFYFKTFTHPTFLELYNLFYKNNIKTINKGFIIKYVDNIALAYWIMCDGSLNKRDLILTLHTENFDKETNLMIIEELNLKFNLNSRLGVSRRGNNTYYMVYIPSKDLKTVIALTHEYIITSMKYKINNIKLKT